MNAMRAFKANETRERVTKDERDRYSSRERQRSHSTNFNSEAHIVSVVKLERPIRILSVKKIFTVDNFTRKQLNGSIELGTVGSRDRDLMSYDEL